MMTLDEAIKHCEEKAKELSCKADEDYYFDGDWGKRVDCLECAREHGQLAEWLKHYQAIRQIIHEWGCDYEPINPDRQPRHSKAEYFEMILATFDEGDVKIIVNILGGI